ncbi:unnamed protein product [Sphagnum jensenii]|uniref:Uncharacterized protein n=1 Tax=Sphagnum jensenii TaxID=128206 RepID=A0ABP1A960_9BRYO
MKTVQITCQFQLPVFSVACQKTAIIGFLKILQCGETAHLSCLGCGFLSEGDFKVDDEVNFIDADRLAQSTVKLIFPCGRYKPTLFYAISAGLHF